MASYNRREQRERTNHNSKKSRVTGAKSGKMDVFTSPLVLGLKPPRSDSLWTRVCFLTNIDLALTLLDSLYFGIT